MIGKISPHRPNDAKIIRVAGRFLEQFTNNQTGLAILGKSKRRGKQAPVCRSVGRFGRGSDFPA